MTTPTAKREAASDNLILQMLQARTEMQTTQQIARRHDLTPENVRTITNRVRSADMAESGEPVEAVRAAYGWRE